MSPANEHERQFVAYLTKLSENEERAALAALRRGLGKNPGEAAETYPYVVPWLPRSAPQWQEDAFFAVASLFAYHQIPWERSDNAGVRPNFGASFARLAAVVESASVERRFIALLNCHRDDLFEHLRRNVALLKSKVIPIDWASLLHDVRAWNRDDRSVQRDWARSFWRSADLPPGGDASGAEVRPVRE